MGVKARFEASKRLDAPAFFVNLRKADSTLVLAEIKAVPMQTGADEVYAISATVTLAPAKATRRTRKAGSTVRKLPRFRTQSSCRMVRAEA
jgi:hypothetical protein